MHTGQERDENGCAFGTSISHYLNEKNIKF